MTLHIEKFEDCPQCGITFNQHQYDVQRCPRCNYGKPTDITERQEVEKLLTAIMHAHQAITEREYYTARMLLADALGKEGVAR